MYVHELDTWPEWTWDTRPLFFLLSKIRYKQGLILGHMQSIGFESRQEAQLEILSKDIISSTAIEGEKLDLTDVRSSIAKRLGIQTGLPKPKRSTEGVVNMMMEALENYSLPLEEEILFKWHAMLFPTGRNNLGEKINVAMWRTDFMQVVSGKMGKPHVHFVAPKAELVPQEMKRFIQWLNQKEIEPILKSAIAHLWFVTIHPFDDGNGRIARAISDLLLARSDRSHLRFYSLSEQIKNDRKNYYKELENAQKGNLNITEWLLWYFQCLNSALDHSKITLFNVFIQAKFWDTHRETLLDETERKIIKKLFQGFENGLSSSKCKSIIKSSQDTATKKLQLLVKKGVLKKSGAGRSTIYHLITPEVTWFW